jgi:hypothetical protein
VGHRQSSRGGDEHHYRAGDALLLRRRRAAREAHLATGHHCLRECGLRGDRAITNGDAYGNNPADVHTQAVSGICGLCELHLGATGEPGDGARDLPLQVAVREGVTLGR